jgi:hypothetical protein
MDPWNTPASPERVEKTAAALRALGYEVAVVVDAGAAKTQALAWIPPGSEVLTGSSITLGQIGLDAELNESGHFDSIKAKTLKMDRATQGREIRKLQAAPDFYVGSVHALTEGGQALVASMSGSQLAATVYGAGKVVWVVGTQKIVKKLSEAHRRIDEYVLDLESVRARKAYGLPETFRSFPNKMVVFQKEVVPGRIKVILVNEVLGF